MIHEAALDQVMHTLTQEARASLSNATPQAEAVKRLEEVVRVHPYAVLFSDNTGRYIGANAAANELTGVAPATNVIPGVHVSVLAKISTTQDCRHNCPTP